MRGVAAAYLFMWLVAFAPSASACADSYRIDLSPKQSAADCSFSDFGITGNWSGNAVRNLGNGKIAQLVVSSNSCPYQEKLLFADCSTGQTVSVDGIYSPSEQREIAKGLIPLGGNLLIKYIQPPFGKVRVSESSTIEGVSVAAQKSGYEWSLDLIGDFRRAETRVRERVVNDSYLMEETWGRKVVRYAKTQRSTREFNPLCGCKLFYPDSEGAKR